MTNVVVGGATVQLNSAVDTVNSNAFSWLPVPIGQAVINLSTSSTPVISYYNQTINVSNGDNYSLFLSGMSPSQVDAVLLKEFYPLAYADSVCGVRFINLSPNSTPISVNIKGNANSSEVASLAYKSYSDFIQHPAKKVNTSYIFEFRNATTGALLTSYTLTAPYFHNVILVLRGLITSPGVMLDQDY